MNVSTATVQLVLNVLMGLTRSHVSVLMKVVHQQLINKLLKMSNNNKSKNDKTKNNFSFSSTQLPFCIFVLCRTALDDSLNQPTIH